MSSFKITKDMEQYIALQRTSILSNHAEAYYSQMELQWNIIKEHMEGKRNVLDIGCGLAGIDYFIAINNPSAEITLLDKSEMTLPIYYGYQKQGAFYNSMELAEEFLKINGVNNRINILTPELYISHSHELEFDAIISLISCGFHYPVSTYINAICNSISIGGIVIMDIRHGAIEESIKIFKDKGFNSTKLFGFEKCDKILFA